MAGIPFFVRVLDSPLGPVKLVFDELGLRRVVFCDRWPSEENASSRTDAQVPPFVERAVDRLRRYFAGERVTFDDIPVRLEQGTPFQRSVWEQLRRVPYGRVVSYAEMARRIGKPRAARAVGGAVGANPVPIVVPCHRVIRADGQLGGFSAGVDRKQALLQLEGVRI